MKNYHIFYLAALAALLASPMKADARNITAVWANDGLDKVTLDELRATRHTENLTGKVINRTWNGTQISLYGAKNEEISFNLVLEAPSAAATGVSVTFDTLTGPNGATIHSIRPANNNGVFNWVNRPIELFYARYVAIHNLSWLTYDQNNDVDVPVRFRQTNGADWGSRPDHDKMYPDALVPLELVPTFTINAGQNQSIWADLYVPKGTPAGTYTGNVVVSEGGSASWTIPVQLTVYGFTLPDTHTSKTMVVMSTTDIMYRYVTGLNGYVNWASADGQRVAAITDKYYQVFHRHGIDLVGDNECAIGGPTATQACPSAVARLNGSIFNSASGYDGPGVNTGVSVYSIGTYRTYPWEGATAQSLQTYTDAWVSWFNQNSPQTEYSIYLWDEPDFNSANESTMSQYAQWIANGSGPGRNILTLSTYHPVYALNRAPALSIPVMSAGVGGCADGASTCSDLSAQTAAAANYYKTTAGKRLWAYNSHRPAAGSHATEDDGVALRELPWGQYKLGIQRWFYWSANPVSNQDYFQNAVSFGDCIPSAKTGASGCSNGDGMIVYPGADVMNKNDSYGVDGPIASIRMKAWRRGIEDVDYLAMAKQINPQATQALIQQMVPKAMWEYTSVDSWDTYDNSWSSDPDVWENARAQLAAIIAGGNGTNINTPVTVTGETILTTQTPTQVTTDQTYPNSELGTTFQTAVTGQVVALRFYKNPNDVGVHTGRLWSNGQLLASVNFTNETSSGWQVQLLASPVTVRAKTSYVVSVNTNHVFVATVGGFAGQVISGDLLAPVGAGVYATTVGTFPTSTYQNTNYFADIVFRPGETVLTTQLPALANATDGPNTDHELGMMFKSAVAGQVTAIRFYKAPSETGGVHTGRLWNASGTLLTSVDFTNESASGWQSQTLSQPIALAPNTSYVVSVNTVNTYRTQTVGGLSSAVVNGDLSSIVGNNGLYGSVGSFPTGSYQGSNYFRDIVFTPNSSGDGLTVPAANPCDVNNDGVTNVQDAQLSANQASGANTCTADVNQDGHCTILDTQRVVNAVLGSACSAN